MQLWRMEKNIAKLIKWNLILLKLPRKIPSAPSITRDNHCRSQKVLTMSCQEWMNQKLSWKNKNNQNQNTYKNHKQRSKKRSPCLTKSFKSKATKAKTIASRANPSKCSNQQNPLTSLSPCRYRTRETSNRISTQNHKKCKSKGQPKYKITSKQHQRQTKINKTQWTSWWSKCKRRTRQRFKNHRSLQKASPLGNRLNWISVNSNRLNLLPQSRQAFQDGWTRSELLSKISQISLNLLWTLYYRKNSFFEIVSLRKNTHKIM